MGLLTVTQVATKMGVHRRTVLNWMKSGKLPYTRIGTTYRVDPDDIDRKKIGGS